MVIASAALCGADGPRVNGEYPMLKTFKGVTDFYANSTVYISDGKKWQEFPNHNWEVKNLKDNGDELWITSGIVVALGACCEPVDALEQLRGIVRKLESEIQRSIKTCEHCSRSFLR
jgi:hypothetical protein